MTSQDPVPRVLKLQTVASEAESEQKLLEMLTHLNIINIYRAFNLLVGENSTVRVFETDRLLFACRP